MSEWISVNDRLPEYGDSVLIAVPGEDCPVIGWINEVDGWKESSEFIEVVGNAYLCRSIEDQITKVTHWKELPSMPDDQQGE